MQEKILVLSLYAPVNAVEHRWTALTVQALVKG